MLKYKIGLLNRVIASLAWIKTGFKKIDFEGIMLFLVEYTKCLSEICQGKNIKEISIIDNDRDIQEVHWNFS